MNLSEVEWGYFNATNDFVATLPQSKVQKYKDILKHSQLEILSERLRKAQTITNYALPVRALNNYVTDINYMMDDALKRRLMKECVQINYTVFVLKKFSPFTGFFSDRMKRFSHLKCVYCRRRCEKGTKIRFFVLYIYIDFKSLVFCCTGPLQ